MGQGLPRHLRSQQATRSLEGCASTFPCESTHDPVCRHPRQHRYFKRTRTWSLDGSRLAPGSHQLGRSKTLFVADNF